MGGPLQEPTCMSLEDSFAGLQTWATIWGLARLTRTFPAQKANNHQSRGVFLPAFVREVATPSKRNPSLRGGRSMVHKRWQQDPLSQRRLPTEGGSLPVPRVVNFLSKRGTSQQASVALLQLILYFGIASLVRDQQHNNNPCTIKQLLRLEFGPNCNPSPM